MVGEIPFRVVAVPLFLQLAVLSGLYFYEGMPQREFLDIWLPWTAIVLVGSTVLFAVFWWACRARNIVLRAAALLLQMLLALFGLLETVPLFTTKGDPLSHLPIALQSVLCLFYFVVLAARLTSRRSISLRSFLVIIGVLCVVFAWWSNELIWKHAEDQAVSAIHTLGGKVRRAEVGLVHFQVEYLSLAATAVRDDNLQVLQRLRKPLVIDLSNTQITDAGLQHLSKLRTVSRLTLTNTNITQHGIEELRRQLPTCHIDY